MTGLAVAALACRLLGGLGTLEAEISSREPQAAAESACLASAPAIETMLARPALKKPGSGPLKMRLVAYHRCLALAAGDYSACAKTAFMCIPYQGPKGPCEPLDRICREQVEIGRISRALITGDKRSALRECRRSDAVCVEHVGCVPPKDEASLHARLCAVVAGSPGETASWRRQARALCSTEPDPRQFNDMMRELLALGGAARACASEDDPLQDCREFATFRSAHAARHPELCGDAPFCLWAMGRAGSGVCERYLRQAREEFCRPPPLEEP